MSAAAPVMMMPAAAKPRFHVTASASAPPGIWLIMPAMPPTESATPDMRGDQPNCAR